MIGQHTTASVPPQKPATALRRLRKTLVVAVILVGTGAVGTTAGLARNTSQSQPTAETHGYVLPSKQVMREMREVIIALYGPQPAATQPAECWRPQ